MVLARILGRSVDGREGVVVLRIEELLARNKDLVMRGCQTKDGSRSLSSNCSSQNRRFFLRTTLLLISKTSTDPHILPAFRHRLIRQRLVVSDEIQQAFLGLRSCLDDTVNNPFCMLV